MTKAEIHERFRRIVARVMARPLDELEAWPVNPMQSVRYVVRVDDDA